MPLELKVIIPLEGTIVRVHSSETPPLRGICSLIRDSPAARTASHSSLPGCRVAGRSAFSLTGPNRHRAPLLSFARTSQGLQS